ncbi:hypothetical protein BGZ61DRAFT_402356 [Ilyonectria robusta]|uniref:uncharacterized protein n=1 Tax=Ilyonectria robusta TaxID=1079257 RepID=UPI001E8D00E2|nr:uncharacterized protein BGZ61DRAFT_402356 [Ilyonectria robusta]KAH8662643.1 hypothetical protein BGZ61DRAFT_402356 [Ilyonectria robusta]
MPQQHDSSEGDGKISSFWDLRFNSQGSMTWESENKTSREICREVGSAGLVEFFMTKSENTNRLALEVEVVMNFCPEHILEELESACPLATVKNVSLLDDRTNDDTDRPSISRGYLGPLNAYKLYLELQKRRFRCQKSDTQTGSDGTQLQPDADRRLIFVTNLDPWTMMAIMATASLHQVGALGTSFYRHLAFESFIGSHCPSNGLSTFFQTFRLAFDLPYYVFRRAARRKPPQDHRGRGPNATHREATDLSFLTRIPAGSPPRFELEYLCQAQVSVLITGSDPWRWVAYCFVDNYFDQEDTGDSPDVYDEDREVDEDTGVCHIQPDPLTAGGLDANFPIKGPREYFLAVLQARLRDIRVEWQKLVSELETLIGKYIQPGPIQTTTTTHHASPNCHDIPTIMNSHVWADQTTALLRKLAQNLKMTIKQLESFEADKVFSTVAERAAISYIPTIREITEDFRKYQQKLEFLTDDCDYYQKRVRHELTFQLSYVGANDAKAQAIMAAYGQTMTFVMLFFFTPIALAASVLSMQPKVIPAPLRLDGTSFIILVIIFMVLIWSAVGVRLNWERITQSLRRILKPDPDRRDLEYQED